MIREDDTPVHKAVREALTNSIIHADMMTTGVLRIEKRTELRDNPLSTRKELTENIENLSWASSKYQLAQLKKLGYLDRVGSDRAGH